MDTFFSLLKKSIVATVLVLFAFVVTYTPQDWNKIETAYAGGSVAQEPTQMAQFIADKAFQAVSIAKETITAVATNGLWIQDSILDGIAWSIAKQIVHSMVQSLVDWINSGFEGSPMFVQDLSKFLQDAADRAVGEYLDELGGLGSFLCDPFKLDVRLALGIQYFKYDREQQAAPKCTLTGIIDNIEGFMSGVQGSFGEGGWNDWFDITAQPEVYTPYGAILAAESNMTVRVLNAKNEEAAKLSWGDGFLSGEVCNSVVDSFGVSKEWCDITKPGKVIQEALTLHLDSGRQALISADEVNEVISALLGQLANKALTGAAGLLGLSAASGSSYSGFDTDAYLNQLNTASALATGLSDMQTARDTQATYRNSATTYRQQLLAYAANTNNPTDKRNEATTAAAEALTVIDVTTGLINSLNPLITRYSNATDNATKETILQEFSHLIPYSYNDIRNSEFAWSAILYQ